MHYWAREGVYLLGRWVLLRVMRERGRGKRRRVELRFGDYHELMFRRKKRLRFEYQAGALADRFPPVDIHFLDIPCLYAYGLCYKTISKAQICLGSSRMGPRMLRLARHTTMYWWKWHLLISIFSAVVYLAPPHTPCIGHLGAQEYSSMYTKIRRWDQ